MTHWRDVHKRKTPGMLYAEMVGPVGTKRVVRTADSGTITLADPAGSGGEAQATEMPWVSFEHSPLKLGLNRTNCKVLETITGSSQIERWKGVWITITVIRTKYPDKQTKQRLETDAIRIAPSPPSDDEVKDAIARRSQQVPPQKQRTGGARPARGDAALTAAEIAEYERIEREENRK